MSASRSWEILGPLLMNSSYILTQPAACPLHSQPESLSETEVTVFDSKKFDDKRGRGGWRLASLAPLSRRVSWTGVAMAGLGRSCCDVLSGRHLGVLVPTSQHPVVFLLFPLVRGTQSPSSMAPTSAKPALLGGLWGSASQIPNPACHSSLHRRICSLSVYSLSHTVWLS